MVRPRLCRRIGLKPSQTYFKPAGVRMTELQEVVLALDEYEAMRLVDLKEIDQNKAGKMMRVSQPTFSRLLKSARKKIVDAIVNGKAIKVEGGNYEFYKR